MGLKSNGTVVAVGCNALGQCDVGGWTDIVQVAAGGYHTVGLKSDGTVVAVGRNLLGQCDVDTWTGIIQVAAGEQHTVGLKADGTLVAAGDNAYEQCDVGTWNLRLKRLPGLLSQTDTWRRIKITANPLPRPRMTRRQRKRLYHIFGAPRGGLPLYTCGFARPAVL